MQGASTNKRQSNGRKRLLATARELFTTRGASHVGINDVTDIAGVARMTLYNNFASKDELVHAVYEEMTEQTLRELFEARPESSSEAERIAALFDHFEHLAKGGNRGCPFIHASLDTAEPVGIVYDLIRAYKLALREHIRSLLNDGRIQRDQLADLILILLDGSATEDYLKTVKWPIASAKRAALVLLEHVG